MGVLQMTTNGYDIINRDAIRAGDLICRDSGGFVGKSIKWATSTKESQTLWNHDAIVVNQRGHLCIGDALMGRDCQLTVIFEWEQGCRLRGHKLIVLRPANATAADGEVAAQAWLDGVWGTPYDKVAIFRLLTKKIFGDRLKYPVGLESHFFCTEGVAQAWKRAAGYPTPWCPRTANETPGHTCAAWRNGRLTEVKDAFTNAGERFHIKG
jgi:hypothetical protein